MNGKPIIKPFLVCWSLVVLIFCSVSVNAQTELPEKDLNFFKKNEAELQALQKKLFATKHDSIKAKLNKDFVELWEKTLSAELSWFYPFDSLNQVGRLVSPDETFRIINWNTYNNDGSHEYFGFIQTYDKKKKKYELFKLIDKSATVKNPETYIGEPDKWFGMLYYKIIKSGDTYTLLGWDGNDKLTQKKFIDVLYFKDNGDPYFGKDIFNKIPKKNPRRVVFEYSSEIAMSLHYNEEKKMIIFDHLAPRDPLMEGMFQYYGPDFSYDAFDLSKGKWKYVPDVDIKNIKNKKDNVVHKENKKEKPVYTPK
ncbi:MAG: hypothetical protein Q8M29_19260 [Bacteroidota bacterium]|nr:hypothetical protein [Bacteroidota bacterium]